MLLSFARILILSLSLFLSSFDIDIPDVALIARFVSIVSIVFWYLFCCQISGCYSVSEWIDSCKETKREKERDEDQHFSRSEGRGWEDI